MTDEESETQPPTEPGGWSAHRQANGPQSTDVEVTARCGPADHPERYELLGLPQSGGEGLTWHARHTTSDSGDPIRLAVKQLHRPVGAPLSWPSAAELSRLNSHRIVLTSLRANHLVPVIDVFVAAPIGTSDKGSVPYVIMPWIDGPSLAECLNGKLVTRATLPERLTLVSELAEAVDALHSKTTVGGAPLVHRDIKPGNCLLSPDSGLLLVDITNIRAVADGYDPAGMRTPAYAAPEVLSDAHAARLPSSDVYSVGAVAFFCLTGQHPPRASEPDYLRTAKTQLTTVLPGHTSLVGHLLGAMDPEPAARPTDILGWAHELTRLGGPSPRPYRLQRGIAACAAALAVVAAASGGAIVIDHRFEEASRPSPRSTRTPAANHPASGNSTFVQITAPSPRAGVTRCQEIDGTSQLPASTTLVTTMRNLSTGEPEQYPQPVIDWDAPSRLRAWHGLQYFGQATSGIGQTYEAAVYSVPLSMLRRQHASIEATGQLWWFTAVPAGWHREAWIDVRRVAGASFC